MAPPTPTYETVWRRIPKLPQAEGADFDFSDNPTHAEYTFSQGTSAQRKFKAGLRWMLLLASGVSVSVIYFGMRAGIEGLQDVRADFLADGMKKGEFASTIQPLRLAHPLAQGAPFTARVVRDQTDSDAKSVKWHMCSPSWPRTWVQHTAIMAALLIPATLIVLVEPQSGGSGIPEVIAYLNGIVAPRSFDGFVVCVKIVGTILSVGSGLAIGPEGPTIHLAAAITLNMVWVAHTLLGDKYAALSNDHDKRLFLAAGSAAGIACAFRAPVGGVIFALEEAISHFDANLIVRTYFICVISYFTLTILVEGKHLDTDRFTEYQLSIGCNVGYDAEDIFLFAILGVFGGLLGALFNHINMKLNYWRKKHIGPYGYRRLIEVLVIILCTSILVVFVPTTFGCTSINNIVNHIPKFDTIQDCARIDSDPNVTAIPFGYCLSQPVNRFCQHGPDYIDEERLEHLYELKLLRTSLCAKDADPGYNELETLMQGSGHEAVAVLFEEGATNVFGYASLFTFLFIYFFLAVISSGASIPGGLVIPMMTIGGTMGRLWALIINDTIKNVPGKTPIDPGAWAQVGAAAFWCGSGRVTVTIAVIILETTGEYSYLPAIGIAVQFAKWVGDYINPGLYHQLIHLKAMDLLEYVPRGATKGAYVRDIMVKNVKTVPTEGRCGDLRTMIQGCNHNGFPVVDEVNGALVLRGLVLRKYLAPRVISAIPDDEMIDLTMLMTRTPYTCEDNILAFQALNMFRLLGIRHLIVRDHETNAVVGILTRKDFHALHDWGTHGLHVKDTPFTTPNHAHDANESIASDVALSTEA